MIKTLLLRGEKMIKKASKGYNSWKHLLIILHELENEMKNFIKSRENEVKMIDMRYEKNTEECIQLINDEIEKIDSIRKSIKEAEKI